jgi:integrase
MAGRAGRRRGTVRQSANGTWFFVVDVADENGRRRQTRRRGFASQRAAQNALNGVLRDLAERTYVAPSRQTLATFLTDEWLPAIETTIRPSTFDSYSRNVRNHVAKHPLGDLGLQKVDAAALNRFYADLLAGRTSRRPLAPRSVAYIHVILHRAFRDAVRWDRLVRNPCDSADPPKPGRSHRSTMRTWSAEEVATFLGKTADHRLSAAWWVLATTGMRRGELLGLSWDSLDLDASLASIRRTLVTTRARRKGEPGMAWSEPKTDKGWRTVALDAATVAALRAHRARQLEERLQLGAEYDDQGLVFCTVFGTPIHPKTLSWYFDQAVKRAELPRIRLHDLRHSHATLALKAGVHPRVVQERLGHANVGVTLDTYSHVSMPMQAEAASLVASLITSKLPPPSGAGQQQ